MINKSVPFLPEGGDLQAQIRGFVAESSQWIQAHWLNILIANAGIMAAPEGRNQDGFELHMGVNHLGHFLLFKLLQKALLSSAIAEFPSRVVTLSSSGHRGTDHIYHDNLMLEGIYDPWLGYAQSKLANIHMANEIERRFGE